MSTSNHSSNFSTKLIKVTLYEINKNAIEIDDYNLISFISNFFKKLP